MSFNFNFNFNFNFYFSFNFDVNSTPLKRVGYPWNRSGTCTYKSKKNLYLTYKAPRVKF